MQWYLWAMGHTNLITNTIIDRVDLYTERDSSSRGLARLGAQCRGGSGGPFMNAVIVGPTRGTSLA